MRPSGRAQDQLRDIVLETDVSRYAEGSCLAKFGNTHVLCTASVEDGVPSFLRDTGKGWVTAEYGMLPRSTHSRMDRKRTADSGRSQEISRLIGRSLRAVVDMKKLGERQIRIDCDVIQADGGTRTAAITGGYVALALAINHMTKLGALTASPLKGSIAAISCGLYQGEAVLDLDYDEDSTAQADANFVLTGTGGVVEVQGTAEGEPFSEAQFLALMKLAQSGCATLTKAQNIALGVE